MSNCMFEGNFAFENFDDIKILKEDVNSVMAVAFSKANNDEEKEIIKMVADAGTDTIINAYHKYCIDRRFGSGPDWIAPYDYLSRFGFEEFEEFCCAFIRDAAHALKAEEHVIDAIKEGYFDNDILRDIFN